MKLEKRVTFWSFSCQNPYSLLNGMNKLRQLTRNDFEHEIIVATRWGDMDALGHINHAKVLTYIETARVEYYLSLGFGNNSLEQNPSIILSGMNIDYISQIEHPSELSVCNRINRVGSKSVDFLCAVFQKSQVHPCIVGTFKMISFDYKRQITINVPDLIRNRCWHDS